MTDERQNPYPTLALNTKVEEDFVAPLTSVRGALEILRDFPHLNAHEQQRFVETALRGCLRLEQSIDQLSAAVYAAGQKAVEDPPAEPDSAIDDEYRNRIHFLADQDIVELDFSNFAFTGSSVVNAFFDSLERLVEPTGHSWYFLINLTECSIWPESWVAFAHRSKRINHTCSLGTVRYTDTGDAEASGSDVFASREDAIRRIETLKSETR
ncbi:MAG: hypothetical protein RIM72_02515 [Alphaproteobacteria bacterium]